VSPNPDARQRTPDEAELLASVRRCVAPGPDQDLHWEDVPGGWTAGWAKRLRFADQDLFCKRIEPNEARALALIAPLGLEHMLTVPYPELLSIGLLVTPFVDAPRISIKRVSDGLLSDLATVQNHLNQPPHDQHAGRATHGPYLLECLQVARQHLPQLKEPWSPALERWSEWLRRREQDEAAIAAVVNAMPRGWLHHDFREANILDSRPQLLVDWGSSWGHGPFLFDVAPFIYGRPVSIAAFCGTSDIARACLQADFERWLVAATAARAAGYIRWASIRFLSRGTPMADIERELDYEWGTYGLSDDVIRGSL